MENDVHILIVEDSRTQALEIQYFLEQNDYKVSVAEDGEQAFDMLKDITPTIIVSDIIMPRMNGYELCDKIKKNDRLKKIPIILLTSLSDPEDVINGLICGASNFIVKPFDKKFLLSRIRYILINQEIRETASSQMGIEIIFREKKYFLSSERVQMIDLLLSTYEVAIQKNLDFQRSNEELQQARKNLEKRVRERTAELSKSNVQLQKEIEERKHAEEALRRSENELAIKNRISQVFITAPDDKLFGNVLQVILDTLKSKYGVFGYIDEDGALVCPSMTKDVWEEFEMPGKDIIFPRESWAGIWGKALAEGKTLYSNKPLKVPEGHIQITRALDVPIIHRGNVIGNLLIGNKETNYEKDDVRLMEAIASHLAPLLNARLQRDRQTKERKNLEEQLRQAQKMEAIGTLAGGVAHDFNNILTIIIGNAGLALIRVGKDDILREEIEQIKTAGERAAILTRQLLAFSRKQIVQPQIINCNKLLSGMEKMLGRLLNENVELLTIFETALWKVKADPGQMEQVIMNLVVNARDAMPMGGKLIIETTNANLDENYFCEHGIKNQPGSYVVISVSDTGSGMDKKTLEHIFEPFYTTKSIGKGTGLGLSTVYGIVKQNNGFIWVYSESGQGTTFKVYISRAKEDAELEEKERTPVDDLRGTETILIVEDDDSLRKLVRIVLKQNGYKVLTAENGEDAMRISKEHEGSIDLIVTDVVMPKMGGKEVVERLQPLYPDMKVIYMSGYTDNAIVHHGVLAPGLNFFEKPFSPEGLARKVREILNSA